jgi:hypothetical protein
VVLIGKFKSSNVLKLYEKRPRLELTSGEFLKRHFAMTGSDVGSMLF